MDNYIRCFTISGLSLRIIKRAGQVIESLSIALCTNRNSAVVEKCCIRVQKRLCNWSPPCCLLCVRCKELSRLVTCASCLSLWHLQPQWQFLWSSPCSLLKLKLLLAKCWSCWRFAYALVHLSPAVAATSFFFLSSVNILHCLLQSVMWQTSQPTEIQNMSHQHKWRETCAEHCKIEMEVHHWVDGWYWMFPSWLTAPICKTQCRSGGQCPQCHQQAKQAMTIFAIDVAGYYMPAHPAVCNTNTHTVWPFFTVCDIPEFLCLLYQNIQPLRLQEFSQEQNSLSPYAELL